MIEQHYLDDCLLQLRKLKTLADKAIGQIEDEHLFTMLDPEANSIAIIMKHLAGNMRSRWTEFLTSDGEKPDRDRDREFVLESDDTRPRFLRGGKRAGTSYFRRCCHSHLAISGKRSESGEKSIP
jgi:hypothetical protein